MAVTNGYIDLADLKHAVGDTADDQDSLYEVAIEAASRKIDEWCDSNGTRHFWSVSSPEPRLFRPVNRYLVNTGFFSNTAGLVVKSDDDGDGVFETTWSVGDWQAEPGNRPNGEVFDRLVAPGTRGFPLSGRRECVEVTAMWGWETVPAPVRQATQILAVALYKSKDFTGGDVGFNQLENAGGWSVYDLARSLIEPYQVEPTPSRTAA